MIKMPKWARWLAVGLAGMLVVASCASRVADPPSSPAEAEPGSALPPATRPAESLAPGAPTQPDHDLLTLWPPDAIPAIDDPQFHDMLGAELEYRPDEMVLGLELNGDARAYPIGVLVHHEVVNDVVGGQPIAVTYCPVCSTGIVYSREIEGQVHTFGVSGKLLRNVLVLYDRETNSLWSQLLSEAIEGELKGTKLEWLPARLMTWAEWKARHPQTLALVKGNEGSRDPDDGYDGGQLAAVLAEAGIEAHLPAEQFVTGVEVDGEAVAYPWSVLSLEPVVNDQVGETPVLVVFDADTATSVAFDRTLEGQPLTFSLSDPETLTLTDDATGSRWAGVTGQALEGSLAGKQLDPVQSTASFWSEWMERYPEVRVHGLGNE